MMLLTCKIIKHTFKSKPAKCLFSVHTQAQGSALQTLISAFPGHYPDNKVHGANMRPTWVLSAPDGPMNLVIRVGLYNPYNHLDILLNFMGRIQQLSWSALPRAKWHTGRVPNSKVHRAKVGPMLAAWTLLSGVLSWAKNPDSKSHTLPTQYPNWNILDHKKTSN